MKNLLVRRSAVGLALGALAGTGLAMAPSTAHAAIIGGELDVDTSFSDSGSDDCTVSVSGSDPSDKELLDNGVPVTQSWSRTATSSSAGDPTDIVDLSSSGSATLSLTPIGTGPATLSASVVSRSSVVPRKASTNCDADASGGIDGGAAFQLPQPMWATVTVTGRGRGSSQVQIGSEDAGVASIVAGKGESSSQILLPAGDTYLSVSGGSYADTSHRVVEFSGTITVDLLPLGHPAAQAGKAGYVQFGARDCGTGNVAAAITKRAKKKAEQVLIKVNGAKVAKFKGKKLKKRALVLPAAPAAGATVEATIKLKNGKKVTVTRSYLACS